MTRVVVLTPYFHPVIGGVESNAARFATYLQKSGVPVQILTKRLSRSLPDVDRVLGLPLRRVGPFGERSPGGKWVMSPSVFLWLVLHRAEYDAVCVVDYRGVGVAAVAARTLTARPVMVQAQTSGVISGDSAVAMLRRFGARPDGRADRLLKRCVRAVYGRADAFACISKHLVREATESGIPAARVHLLPNAIDMSRFRPPTPDERAARRAALGLRPDQVACMFVGRLSREKGVVDLVEAWKLLQPAPAVLLLVGPDMAGHSWDAGEPAREYVKRQGLSDSVRFVGPADDVVPLLHAADVVVQPSHFEALGLSAIEALATGVPVVASAVGGLLDFMVDGVNGRLAPAQDPRALSSALGEVIADSNLRQRVSAAARASVADYDEDTVFGRMRDLLTAMGRR
jgi:glycosyltransferase involved in cell wall biosynthesis